MTTVTSRPRTGFGALYRAAPGHRPLAWAVALLVPILGAGLATTTSASAAVTASVSVDAGKSLATIPSTGVGTNVAVYDGNMNQSAVPGLLGAAGIDSVRYPGGSYGDIYHWQTNTTDGGYVAPGTDFDTYMSTVKSAGAQPIIIANYGTGTAQEAADWVKYANVTKKYGVKYWEIGNEVYGNGEYGSSWETDHHSSHSATTYANNLLQYISAMKAVDPTIKIGAVLTTPGSWPDGLTGSGDTQDWNHTVLSIAGSKIDFGIVHHYPTSTGEADMLGKPQAEIPGMASTLHSLISQYAGANAANVGIAVTEANGNSFYDTAPSGLFAPDEYLTWMENGAFTVDWWNLHNGTDCSKVTTVDGSTDYNDYGVLSSGSSCEPPLNTPFAPYYGTRMITELGAPGDTLVKAGTSTSLLTAHAVKRANGDLDVMLINKDPSNAATVSLSYNGFTPSSATPTVYSYLKNGTSITSATAGSATAQSVPAYSIAVVQLHPGSGGTTTGGSTTGGATTGGTTTGGTTTGGTTTGGTTTGGTTGGTGAGSCTVTYTKNEWQGGLTASVTVADTGSAPVNGWTLTFSFPGDTKVTSAWNATVTQSGSTVTATNVSYNSTIPAGGNVSFGFQGTWTGNDANPTSFALNGSSCATG
ncbi:cellulose binding domain-containing protein [Actinacidiphila acididurans]|uniref:Cellulose binding domain-containing protein n=1 Tax=Actinacidiphila acididurans TaxID=2784346 RepID=A0ABS2TI37_9ACTN|nr:cellulose binding domain-containing protein [Actinacidiphila acididurans]MBM9503008.1 cellulose binding domain-containing protein [Actinacidiphila acididurans]